MKHPLTLIVGCAFLFFVAGCATPYQPVGLGGGYSETQLAPDVFRVNVRGNGYTSNERAQDFALLRAAELTLQHGFKYFAIIDESSSTDVSTYSTPGSSQTTGSSTGTANVYGNYGTYQGTYSGTTTYNPPQTYNIHKPRSSISVRCFADKPDSTYTFDAVFLQQSISQKYGIK